MTHARRTHSRALLAPRRPLRLPVRVFLKCLFSHVEKPAPSRALSRVNPAFGSQRMGCGAAELSVDRGVTCPSVLAPTPSPACRGPRVCSLRMESQPINSDFTPCGHSFRAPTSPSNARLACRLPLPCQLGGTAAHAGATAGVSKIPVHSPEGRAAPSGSQRPGRASTRVRLPHSSPRSWGPKLEFLPSPKITLLLVGRSLFPGASGSTPF
jgi:hypothetical protein